MSQAFFDELMDVAVNSATGATPPAGSSYSSVPGASGIVSTGPKILPPASRIGLAAAQETERLRQVEALRRAMVANNQGLLFPEVSYGPSQIANNVPVPPQTVQSGIRANFAGVGREAAQMSLNDAPRAIQLADTRRALNEPVGMGLRKLEQATFKFPGQGIPYGPPQIAGPEVPVPTLGGTPPPSIAPPPNALPEGMPGQLTFKNLRQSRLGARPIGNQARLARIKQIGRMRKLIKARQALAASGKAVGGAAGTVLGGIGNAAMGASSRMLANPAYWSKVGKGAGAIGKGVRPGLVAGELALEAGFAPLGAALATRAPDERMKDFLERPGLFESGRRLRSVMEQGDNRKPLGSMKEMYMGTDDTEFGGVMGALEKAGRVFGTIRQGGKAAIQGLSGAALYAITGDKDFLVDPLARENWAQSGAGAVFEQHGFRDSEAAKAYGASVDRLDGFWEDAKRPGGAIDIIEAKWADRANLPDDELQQLGDYRAKPEYQRALAEKTGKTPGVETALTPGQKLVADRNKTKLYVNVYKQMDNKDLVVGGKRYTKEYVRSLSKDEKMKFFQWAEANKGKYADKAKKEATKKGVGEQTQAPQKQASRPRLPAIYQPTKQERLILHRARTSRDTRTLRKAEAIQDKVNASVARRNEVAAMASRGIQQGTPISRQERVAYIEAEQKALDREAANERARADREARRQDTFLNLVAKMGAGAELTPDEMGFIIDYQNMTLKPKPVATKGGIE